MHTVSLLADPHFSYKCMKRLLIMARIPFQTIKMLLEYFKEVKITLLMIISGVPLLPHMVAVYKCMVLLEVLTVMCLLLIIQ